MARYTVHSRPGPEALERAVFVRDGFNVAAFLFGPFWLFAKGAWRAGLVSLTFLVVLVVALGLIRLPDGSTLGVLLLVQFLIGLEASTLRRWELRFRGFDEVGLVAGGDLDTLERRFFAEQAAGPAAPMPAPVPAPRMAPGASVPGVIGLFPSPGGQPGPRP